MVRQRLIDYFLWAEPVMGQLIRRRLRYLPVLAIGTPEVTSCGSQRQDIFARVEVEERFFFNRVHAYRARIAVGHGIQYPVPVFSCVAHSRFVLLQQAHVRT